jgi:capsular exopolysaccharide synthesis family protein
MSAGTETLPVSGQPARHGVVGAPARLESRVPFADDFRTVLDALRRRFGLFLLVVAAVMAAAAVWLHYKVPLYLATATIVLDSPRQVVPSAPSVLSDSEPESSILDTQVEVIRSRVVVGRTVDMLGLAGNAEGSATSRAEIIDDFRDSLSVARIGLSRALSISYEDQDPQQAARVANAVARAYLDHQLDEKRQATKEANQWLRQSVDELAVQVASAEAAVETYRARAGLLVVKGATSTENELADIDSGLSNARKDLGDAEARLSGYQGAFERYGAASAAAIVATPTMQGLRGQYGALMNQKAQLSPTLGALHPQMVELEKQIAGLKEQLNAEARRTIDELRGEVSIAANKLEALTKVRDRSRRRLITDNSANVELIQLQSNAESLRGLYVAMLNRLQQTAAQESLGQVNATIVSEAVAPLEPSSPRRNVVLLGAAMAGIVLAMLTVVLMQLFDHTIVRPSDLELWTGLPLLALVPRLTRRDLRIGTDTFSMADVVLGKPMSLFTESFRNLRAAVFGLLERRESLVIQVTSGTFGEGKTLCSIAFARTAALDGKRVLLIDADTRRRSLSESLGIDATAGLSELLRGKVELNDVIVPGGTSRRPHVLPLAKTDPQPYDLFSTQAFEQLLEKLRKDFDIIVIDSAPVLALAEPISIAARVDAIVLVARWAKTPVDVTLKALEELKRAGGRVVGTVLTHVNVRSVSRRAYGRQYYPALMRYYR